MSGGEKSPLRSLTQWVEGWAKPTGHVVEGTGCRGSRGSGKIKVVERQCCVKPDRHRMKDALLFCYGTFVATNPANQPPDHGHSFLMAVQRIANPGVTEMKSGADWARIDLDVILRQRSSLHQCAEVVGMPQLAVAFVFFALSVFAGHVF